MPAASRDGSARLLAVKHPRAFVVIAVVEIAIGVIVGIAIAVSSHRYGVAVGVAALIGLSAVSPICSVVWTRRHPGRAAASVSDQRRRRDHFVRHHPVLALVGVPIAIGAYTGLRYNTGIGDHHGGESSWLISTGAGLLGGLVVMAILALRAHSRDHSSPGTPGDAPEST